MGNRVQTHNEGKTTNRTQPEQRVAQHFPLSSGAYRAKGSRAAARKVYDTVKVN